jgi:dienelactone hydrolase
VGTGCARDREAIDARAALAFLRARPDVDQGDVAFVGDSFGSSLTLVVGEHEPALRAVVVFATAGYPPIGRTREDGHGFLYSGVSIWENDVFAFLDQHMRR